MKSKAADPQTHTLADFRPFRPWRYDMTRVRPEDVLAPPYDVIAPAAQDKLYEKSPYNCIRLILNRILDEDNDGDNRYTRARDFFNKWKEEQILIREDKPGFYVYQQKFTDPLTGARQSRSAFLGALKLEPFEKQVVIPHEKTLAKPRADRRKLLEVTETNFSPVFGLFEDPGGGVVSLLPELTSGEPVFRVTDEHGVSHSLWAVTDEDATRKIHQSLSTQRVYIADGHHRYTTALQYGQEQHEKKGAGETMIPSDFIYAALVSFQDPGLALLPTHRMVANIENFEVDQLLSGLKDFFEVSESSPETLMKKVDAASHETCSLGMISQGRGYLLTLRDFEKAKANMLPGKPEIWYRLDVNVFAYLILKNVIGLPEDKWEAHLTFTHSDEGAMRAEAAREVQAAFLLKAPGVEVLSDMGEVRELMPQKSTYFYPKLASGLLFYQHEDGAIPNTK